VWKGNASSGTLSGTVQGDNLSGTLVNNEAGQSASFSITLAPDGHSFSGTFTIVGGSTGQWRSACTAGACLSNTPPPPPPPPPGGGPPPAPTSPKLLAAATAWGQVGPATALEPGGEAIATSPPIAPGQRGASVTLNGDTAGQTAVVIGPVTRTQHRKTKTRGDCVRAVAQVIIEESNRLTGYARLAGTEEQLKKLDAARDEVVLSFLALMAACLDHLKKMEQQATPAVATSAANAARSSCKLQSRPFSVRYDRASRRVSYSSRRASGHSTSGQLRISCRRANNGALNVRFRTRSRRTKLRKVLGPRLIVGLHRAASASGTANVQTTFKRR
jgi:hypothetical protein